MAPDRLDERLAAAARDDRGGARAPATPGRELQARNWRVVDLFELGDMDAWRAEVGATRALADELRLPAFQWYTPLWRSTARCSRGASRRRSA